MAKYKSGRIYKILNNVDDDVYVGSTIEPLCKRMYKHKWEATHDKEHSPLYQKIRDMGIQCFYIELIENYPCASKEELRAREGHWIRQLGTLNRLIAGRTSKEYQTDNKEHLTDYRKNYYKKNLDHINEYKEANKERIKQYMKQYNKEYNEKHVEEKKQYDKQYREEHKEQTKEYHRKYKENNKDKLKEFSSLKITCECGREVRKVQMTKHLKSNIHKTLMDTKSTTID